MAVCFCFNEGTSANTIFTYFEKYFDHYDFEFKKFSVLKTIPSKVDFIIFNRQKTRNAKSKCQGTITIV